MRNHRIQPARKIFGVVLAASMCLLPSAWGQGAPAGTKPDLCYRTGCNDGELCVSGRLMLDGAVGGTCSYEPEMYCAKFSECGHFGQRLEYGQRECGWKRTEAYRTCLDAVRSTRCFFEPSRCEEDPKKSSEGLRAKEALKELP